MQTVTVHEIYMYHMKGLHKWTPTVHINVHLSSMFEIQFWGLKYVEYNYNLMAASLM